MKNIKTKFLALFPVQTLALFSMAASMLFTSAIISSMVFHSLIAMTSVLASTSTQSYAGKNCYDFPKNISPD
jgi:hypothetical protein